MQGTKWRILPRNSSYIVSNNGEIAKVCRPHANKKGYLRLQPRMNGTSKVMFIHRAVGLAWIPNPKRKATINHRNMIVDDNRVVNLEWMTFNENRKHRDTGGTPVLDDSDIPELWRPVPGFDTYIASNKGSVAKMMRPKVHDMGYLKIKIQYNSARKDFYMQRLVAEAWIDDLEEDYIITHINGDRQDNRVSNIRVTTQSEVINKSIEKGRTIADQKGVNNGNAKIARADVYEIRRRYDRGEQPIKISQDYPIGNNMVSDIGRRKHWSHLPEKSEANL